MVVRKYIQSALEEKLFTSDIGGQWCSAKIVQALYLILQLSSAAIPIINNVFLGEGRRSHATAKGSVALCGDWIIIFSIFFGWGWRLFGDWQCGW
jgi:hypothetical protein